MRRRPARWDKRPEARARDEAALTRPDDPRFPSAVAALLTATNDVAAVRRQVPEGLAERWRSIRREMRQQGASEERVFFWDRAIRRLAPRPAARAGKRVAKRGADPRLTAFGGEVRRRRIAEGISIPTLAARLGTTPAIVSRLERGLYNPSLEFLFRIEDAMDWKVPPPLFPKRPLPVRVEKGREGMILLSDGERAIDLSARADLLRDAACGAEMFGHRFHRDLTPEEAEIFDNFCQRIRKEETTLSDAYRVWFYQFHTLAGPRPSG